MMATHYKEVFMIWRAYCVTCGKELEACENGLFAESAARVHLKHYKGHNVIVGTRYEIDEDDTFENSLSDGSMTDSESNK